MTKLSKKGKREIIYFFGGAIAIFILFYSYTIFKAPSSTQAIPSVGHYSTSGFLFFSLFILFYWLINYFYEKIMENKFKSKRLYYFVKNKILSFFMLSLYLFYQVSYRILIFIVVFIVLNKIKIFF